VKYLEPSPSPIALSAVPDLRVYVLGPPRDPKLLGLTASATEMRRRSTVCPSTPLSDAAYRSWSIRRRRRRSRMTLVRFFQDHYASPGPIEPGRAEAGEAETDQSWRRIDADWLGVSSDLAIQLDSKTNNSSLVLAFEFVDNGRVLLFAADAQVGNWLELAGAQLEGGRPHRHRPRSPGAYRLLQGLASRQPQRDPEAARPRAHEEQRSLGVHPHE
jgi:hypothetical protein